MSDKFRNFAVVAAAVCGLVPATAAYAQWYSSDSRQAPAYVYQAQPQRPYAVKVGPNTIVIRRAPPRESQRALIEELRRRSYAKHRIITHRKIVQVRPAVIEPRRVVADSTKVIERRRVVYDPPRVIVHRRVVDDPPRVIERYHIVEDCPSRRGLFQPGAWSLSSRCCRCNRY